MDHREQIELYAFGKLSGEALLDFEARLAADPAFAAAVARESEMLRALRLAPEVDLLREQLNRIEIEQLAADEISGKRKEQVVPVHWYLAAAAAVLLAIAAIWFFRQSPVLTPEQIFAAHFHPPKTLNKGVPRGETDADTSAQTEFRKAWARADRQYTLGNYNTAMQTWQRLAAQPEARGFQSDLYYAAGLAAMQAGDFPAAISLFEKIPPGSFQSEVPWYVALCQLRVGNLSEAKKGFKQIAGAGSPFAREAREILARLPAD